MKKLLTGIFILLTLFAIAACEEESSDKGYGSGPMEGGSEKSIRGENLEKQKEVTGTKKQPCDTLSLQEYIIDTFPDGNYLVEFDKPLLFSETKPAVLYFREGGTYIFGVIAKSKPGERNVEVKNLVGYDASFLNLDSTRLGTAFFYLTLFECSGDGTFNVVWEDEVPIHSGFSAMRMKRWGKLKIPFVELNFIDGVNSGYRNFNYFLVNGIKNKPHLMETYESISRRRTMADVNGDDYPDFWEHKFVEDDTALFVKEYDSIPFYWDTTKQLYLTKNTKRWFRKY